MNTTHLRPADLITQLRILQANHDALKKRYDEQNKLIDLLANRRNNCAHDLKPTGMYKPLDIACEKCGSFDLVVKLNRDDAGRYNAEIKGEQS